MPDKPVVKVGLCGVGTVGRGVWNLLQNNKGRILRRTGADIRITHLGIRSPKPDLDTSRVNVCQNSLNVAKDPQVDILIETIGGEQDAKTLVLEAIAHGKHVVTANKALLALHGQEILQAAREQNVLVCFEAAVAGGVPIIKIIREALLADRIHAVRGIVNGTSNYVLSAMTQKGKTMETALEEAKAAGFAEEDSSFDIEGIDSAHKLAILTSIAFETPLAFNKIYTQGISHITPQDIQYAHELGFCIKHLAIGRLQNDSCEIRVHPALVPLESPLAYASGALNAIELQADATGVALYCGAGAGAEPTASAVVADIADIVCTMQSDTPDVRQQNLFSPASDLARPVLPVDQVCTQHYIRLRIQDQPGVLHQITARFSEAQIGIEKVQQRETPEPSEGNGWKSLIIITHETREKTIQATLKAISAMQVVDENIRHIRVEKN